MTAALIAVDWGTTNRRVFILGTKGELLRSSRDDKGVLAVASGQFAGEVAAMRATYGDLPMILAGAVGSAQGWVTVPYVHCPLNAHDIARASHWIEPGRTALVAGAADPVGDVMRGEEVQSLGVVAGGLVPPSALLCLPGTHCKWVQIKDGSIAGFSTALTGELFALLSAHSLLADFLRGVVSDSPAFADGVRVGLSGKLTQHLFRVRASALLGRRTSEESAAFASGLLIGHDVGGEALAAGQSVHVIADAPLDQLYARAIRIAGGEPHIIDSQVAFVAGIRHIWSKIDHANTV